MDRLELNEKWNRIKNDIKEKYSEWFNNDPSFSSATFDEYITKVKNKTGRTTEDIEQEIKDWREDENHL